jgi:hypothetical protein
MESNQFVDIVREGEIRSTDRRTTKMLPENLSIKASPTPTDDSSVPRSRNQKAKFSNEQAMVRQSNVHHPDR